MTLSDNGKDWIASNFGSGNCISHSSQSFTYHDNDSNSDISDSGSSAKMLNRLVDDLVDYVTFGGKIYYSSFTSANGGGASDDDIRWVNNNNWCVGDGGGGPGGGTCTTTASFSYNVDGKTISFTDTSTTSGSGCSISSRLWNLGSGVASQNRTCSRTFPNYNASYPIILAVTDSAGNRKSSSRSVRTGSDSGGTTGCTPGTLRCSGTRGVQECQTDGSWSRVVNCPTGYHCEGAGNCVKDSGGTTDCTAGRRECTDSTHYRTCNSTGHWNSPIRCATGYHCSNGQCVKDSTGGGTGGSTGDTAGPYEVDIGAGQSCAPGDPSFTMNTSGGYAYHTRLSNVSFIGLGGIEITNTHNTCTARFIWVTKVWRGSGYSSCPTATPTASDVGRYYEEGGQANPPMSISKVQPGDTTAVFGNCPIPMSMTGTVTICADLWGNYSKSALEQELEDAGYGD